MRINLALLNIFHNLPKTVLSLAGIGVAIVLIFMQLGFRGAVEDTAINIYRKLDFDVLIRSSNYLHFTDPSSFNMDLLDEVAGMPPVQSVNSVNVSVATWRNAIGEYKGVLVLGIDPDRSPLLDEAINQKLSRLSAMNDMLVDDKSHREFSPLNGKKFEEADIGRMIPVAEQPLKISGIFSMGAGLAANGAAIVSPPSFDQLFPFIGKRNATFGLVKLKSDQDVVAATQLIADKMKIPGNETAGHLAEVVSRDEVFKRELNRWMNETPIGFIFTMGVFIAFLVGAAIVYMVLGNDVANRLHEYATLRAMGYGQTWLAGVVLKQAAYLAILSFVPALLLSFGLYWLTSSLAGLELTMNIDRILFVLVLTFLMCFGSGLLALKKLWQASPADLF